MRRFLLIAACSLALAGCATGSGTSDTPQMAAKKALTAVRAFHDAIALSASAAAKSGACTGACATTVKLKLDQSHQLLVDADGLSDPTNIAADAAAAIALLNDAKGMLP